jgi:pimeloyl-ACP methyl ester carboxylesterase
MSTTIREGRMETQELLTGREARDSLIGMMPVNERRIELAGISTAVLEAGDGPPVVLLHGPGGVAARCFAVIPDLAATHRVIAPDLPGHGTSRIDGLMDGERVLTWLDELIARTCSRLPALVGQMVGGAIAARYAARPGARIERLVLADALGLTPFQPAPEFWSALSEYLQSPTGETPVRLWSRCTFDLDSLSDRLGDRWRVLKAYNLDRASAPEVQAAMHALMAEFAMPGVPPSELARIRVPTALIWGRGDLATPLEVAEAAHARYGWPLHVIEGAAGDTPIEQPAAFLHALRLALEDGEAAPQGEEG